MEGVGLKWWRREEYYIKTSTEKYIEHYDRTDGGGDQEAHKKEQQRVDLKCHRMRGNEAKLTQMV